MITLMEKKAQLFIKFSSRELFAPNWIRHQISGIFFYKLSASYCGQITKFLRPIRRHFTTTNFSWNFVKKKIPAKKSRRFLPIFESNLVCVTMLERPGVTADEQIHLTSVSFSLCFFL